MPTLSHLVSSFTWKRVCLSDGSYVISASAVWMSEILQGISDSVRVTESILN